ncbi:MAG: YezD family protein [Candidatus Omnitrophica bacterium]|nr:YezD family protein [Candidatus Omnitrophota bacterium]
MMGNKRVAVSSALLSQIAEAIGQIRFGTIQITIHDSRVVQIEKAERIRLEQATNLTTGGGHQHLPRADQNTGGRVAVEGEDA